MLLTLTTALHLFSLLRAPDFLYAAIVTASTVASIAWHATDTPATSALGLLDHAFAGLWGIVDIVYAQQTPHLIQVLALNIGIAALNPLLSSVHYDYGHSAWHILSAGKAWVVAGLLAPPILRQEIRHPP